MAEEQARAVKALLALKGIKNPTLREALEIRHANSLARRFKLGFSGKELAKIAHLAGCKLVFLQTNGQYFVLGGQSAPDKPVKSRKKKEVVANGPNENKPSI